MNAKQASLGLGIFSIALGLGELFASRRIADKLDAEGHEGVIKGFGAREIAAGVGILAAPAHDARIWGRVAGDGLDLAALGALVVKSPRNKWVWGAVGFVVGATVIDVLVARALGKGAEAPVAGQLAVA